MKSKIHSVRIEHKTDENPDTSYLGEYTSNYSEGCIDREACGKCLRTEYHYYKPSSNHFPHKPDSWGHVSLPEINAAFDKLPDEWKRKEPNCGNDKWWQNYVANCKTHIQLLDAFYVWEDYHRMEMFGIEWISIGIIAKAEIVVNGVCQIVRSGGLWGTESDSGKEYIAEVEQEELSSLKSILKELGFGDRAIQYAFKVVGDSIDLLDPVRHI